MPTITLLSAVLLSTWMQQWVLPEPTPTPDAPAAACDGDATPDADGN